jgi:hypothetical protein
MKVRGRQNNVLRGVQRSEPLFAAQHAAMGVWSQSPEGK